MKALPPLVFLRRATVCEREERIGDGEYREIGEGENQS
jgi:hypothetical protein